MAGMAGVGKSGLAWHGRVMRKALIALAVLAAPALAANKPALSPNEFVAAAPKGDWVVIAATDLLVLDLAPDAKGHPRRVVIQLMPAPFSQGWIGNLRLLAAARWWDGLSINRVQDNYVVQWGDGEAEDKARAKALPAELAVMAESGYVSENEVSWEFGPSIHTNPQAPKDSIYAQGSGISEGWPVGWDLVTIKLNRKPAKGPRKIQVPGNVWPVHCYGMVGVGRDMPPDTGSGAELYAVIGHAPRHLDRNIALVGRVIEGIEHLSSLPRGTAALGFYATAEERTAIQSVRIGSEVKDLPAYEYLSTESASFAAYAEARANRRDAFFIRPAGGADICNIPVPMRRVNQN
jgi:peptidylprolyl isomerase